jgi:NADH:ubiquinone oxidoreductase subunit K
MLGIFLFILGVLGIVTNRKNLIVMLMSVELILLSINYMLIISSTLLDNLQGQVFALYILVVAAAESAIGLSLLVALYRAIGSISVQFINLLKN